MGASASNPFVRRGGRRPLVLAHRGARRDAPENSLYSFETALSQGADGVELDVRMSRDGHLFIHHDELVRTVGGAEVRLGDLSRSQIEALRPLSGQPLCSLKEALLFSSRTGALLNVELKGDVRAPLYMAREAARQIGIHGGDGVLLSSFAPAQVWTLARCLPAVPVALLLHDEQKVLPRMLPLGPLGASGVHLQQSMVTADLLARVRRRSQLVGVWTVNEPSQARDFSQRGVDLIITDVPSLVLAALRSE